MMEIIPFGDSGVLINFKQEINVQTNRTVAMATTLLSEEKIKGIEHLIPGYCSITVGYDALQTSFRELKAEIATKLAQLERQDERSSRLIHLPVCYGLSHGLDLAEVSEMSGLGQEELIELHLSTEYHVFMIGFLPGFTYMGILPEQLNSPRKSSPRLKVPGRSVGLAGLQTGIYPFDAPGGWQIIGQTPVEIFDGHRDEPFLFRMGDRVRFHRISEEEYDRQRGRMAEGQFQIEELYG